MLIGERERAQVYSLHGTRKENEIYNFARVDNTT